MTSKFLEAQKWVRKPRRIKNHYVYILYLIHHTYCHHTFKKRKLIRVVGSKKIAEEELDKMNDFTHRGEYERHIIQYKGEVR